MAYQPQSVYDARDSQQFNARDKLLPGTYDSGTPAYEDEDEESERYYSEEEDEARSFRPGLVWMCCGLIAAALVTAIFIYSLSGHGAQPGPTLTPPVQQPPATPAPETPPPVLAPPMLTTEQPAAPQLPPATTTRNPLLPAEDMHDNNVCNDNEELYAGLCYKKCALLTKNAHPIRTSSWTCCEREPCTLGNSQGQVGTTLLCTGFDVDGDGNCPHQPGACLTNEELLLGVCYKQCSILTQGKFPYRVGAATCCMADSLMGCFDVRKDATNSDYNTGGGLGDHDQSTPNEAHPPLANLTESVESASTSYEPPTLAPGAGGHAPNVSTCFADEELYAGLCYKKCSLLSEGAYSIRTSSWTCCANHPCGVSNQKGSIGTAVVCNGYDVGGSGAVKVTSQLVKVVAQAGLSCPHKPGGCSENEEMLLGTCYTKCSVLTQGQFPYRLAAATCCQEEGIRACLDIRKVATDPSFNVGILT